MLWSGSFRSPKSRHFQMRWPLHLRCSCTVTVWKLRSTSSVFPPPAPWLAAPVTDWDQRSTSSTVTKEHRMNASNKPPAKFIAEAVNDLQHSFPFLSSQQLRAKANERWRKLTLKAKNIVPSSEQQKRTRTPLQRTKKGQGPSDVRNVTPKTDSARHVVCVFFLQVFLFHPIFRSTCSTLNSPKMTPVTTASFKGEQGHELLGGDFPFVDVASVFVDAGRSPSMCPPWNRQVQSALCLVCLSVKWHSQDSRQGMMCLCPVKREVSYH